MVKLGIPTVLLWQPTTVRQKGYFYYAGGIWSICRRTMMAETQNTDEADEYEIQYGDQFRHIITGKVVTVHTVQDGKVTYVKGGYDSIEELQNALKDEEMSMYEPEAVGDDCWEGDGY